MHRITRLAASGILAVCAASIARAEDQRTSMGGFPVCEASAALLVDCPDSEEKCLLVGDNEERKQLFLYRLRDGARVLHGMQKISLAPLFAPSEIAESQKQVSDIEALVGMPNGEIIAYGSHSRNKKCEKKKKRRRHVRGTLGIDSLRPGIAPFVQSGKHKCKRLFGDDLDQARQSVCTALKRTEDHADDVEGNRADCDADPAFNLEGAVAVPEATDDGASVWVGLRAPLVGGKAVLLRHANPAKALKFDKVAFVDLGGQGVRELTIAGDTVWGIGGSPADGTGQHSLWRFSARDLKHGAVIAPEIAGSIPNNSEGLAIWNRKAIILMDGDEPENDGDTCLVDSDYVVRSVDTP